MIKDGIMRYICQICGYIYDDAKEKIPFKDLPDDWKCPLCGASKSDFKPEEPEVAPEQDVDNAEQSSPIDDNAESLSVGQLAALCSNLARGCEKQYKKEEAESFKQLAAYFSKITPAVNDATVETLYAKLQSDISNYSGLQAVADENKDRGAARVCVWGEKITRMLSSLVQRYLNEGETMLANTKVWLCTVCGFVYVGDVPPELCPVCKVPSWKFVEIRGKQK